MITVNNAIKNLLKAKHRQVVRITVGTTGLILTGEDIAQDGLSIDRYCVSGSSLELGSAIASELTLKLLNFDGKFNNVTLEGQELRVEQGFIDGNNQYWFDMGYFTVDTPPRTKSTINLTALDRMVRFDDSAYAWSTSQTYPKTVAEYVSAVCSRCQVPLATDLSTKLHHDISIASSPVNDSEVTFRNIIQWAAAVMGTCAYINELGQLVFGWITDTDINITPEYRYQGADLWEGTSNITGYVYSRSIEVEVQKSEVIDGEEVFYTDTEVKDETYVAGSEEFAFDLTGNPFVYNMPQTILDHFWQYLGVISYKPFECTTIPFPYIMPLDRIVYTDPHGNEITTIVTNVVHNLNLGSSIAGKGETDTSKGYRTGSPFTPTQNKELTREQFLLEQASAAASSAKASATSAHNAAVSANTSAYGALTSLSVIEDVAGTLNWIREHGSFVQTTDVTVNETTVYFELIDGEYVPIVLPDPSKNPMEEGWYVLDVTDSQSEYIMAHLAVTSAGLWVLPYNQFSPHPLVDSDDNDLVDSDDNQLVDWSKDPQNASGYKVLLSSTGMTVYDGEGVPVANYGETTTIGNQLYYNVFIDNQGMKIRNGQTNLASYGSSTIFYKPDGVTKAVEIDSNGIDIKTGHIGGFQINGQSLSRTITYDGVNFDTLAFDTNGLNFNNLAGLISYFNNAVHIEGGEVDFEVGSCYTEFTQEGISCGNDSQETKVECSSDAGQIYMFSQGTNSATDNRGMYGYNAVGTGHSIIDVTSSNQSYFRGRADSSSDLKRKDVIDDYEWKIDDFIRGLKPIAYKYKYEDGTLGDRIHMGFGAQDVSNLSKTLYDKDLSLYRARIIDENKKGPGREQEYHGEDIDDSKLSWSLVYEELIAPMVLEIQRLMKRVDELEAKIEEMGG